QLNEQTTSPVNAEGRFEIKCLPPDAQYIVYASAKGYGKGQRQLQPEYESNRVELSPFVLKPADRVIAGKVMREDDKPASGVNVQLNGEDQPDGYMTTDSKGQFHFQVCEGQIRLFAYSQNGGGNAQATVEAGDTNVVMTLSSQSGNILQTPRRASLKGGPLPDLATVNLASDTAPAGKPVLLCLFDASQRPSRHVVHQLAEQAAALRQQGVTVLGIQAAVTSDETFNEWKNGSPVSFPVGRVTEKSEKSKWASAVSALPWLILTDANHRVIAEGFTLDELDAQIKNLAK
ncbi:MAG: peroxiredoxin family protein, partial [Limisphaerales bacterium]